MWNNSRLIMMSRKQLYESTLTMLNKHKKHSIAGVNETHKNKNETCFTRVLQIIEVTGMATEMSLAISWYLATLAPHAILALQHASNQSISMPGALCTRAALLEVCRHPRR